jgi:hypothetical protein
MRRQVFKSAVRFRRFPECFAIGLLVMAVIASCGCQSLALGSMTGLSGTRQEKKIRQEAENDPFPSPSDVGLDDLGNQDDAPEK